MSQLFFFAGQRYEICLTRPPPGATRARSPEGSPPAVSPIRWLMAGRVGSKGGVPAWLFIRKRQRPAPSLVSAAERDGPLHPEITLSAKNFNTLGPTQVLDRRLQLALPAAASASARAIEGV